MMYAIKDAVEIDLSKIGNMWFAGKKGGRTLESNHWLHQLREGLSDANALLEQIANTEVVHDPRSTRFVMKLMPSRRNWQEAVRYHVYGNHGFSDWGGVAQFRDTESQKEISAKCWNLSRFRIFHVTHRSNQMRGVNRILPLSGNLFDAARLREMHQITVSDNQLAYSDF